MKPILHDTNVCVFVLEISPRWIERLREDSLTLRSTIEFSGAALPQLSARLNREFHKTDSAAHLAIEGLALELLAEAVRRPATGMRATPPWLSQAREMIAERFAETLTLTQVAAQVGIHPVHLAAEQFVTTAKLPVRFYLAVGTFEVDKNGTGGEILESTRTLRDVLTTKGYEVHS